MAEFTPITSQEQFDEMVKDRLDRQSKKFEAEKAEYVGKYEGYLSNDDVTSLKSDYEKKIEELNAQIQNGTEENSSFKSQLEEKENALKKAQLDYLKVKVAIENNVPFSFADRLRGETEEELASDALNFSESFKTKTAQPIYQHDDHDVDGVTQAFKALNPKLKI